MRVIRQSAEMLQTPKTPSERVSHVELCGRTCYKSEDKITADSGRKFIKSLIRNGHESVIEHARLIVRIDGILSRVCTLDLAWLAESGWRSFMTMTYWDGGLLLSGNMRAWRDYAIQSRQIHKYNLEPIQAVINENEDFFPEFDPQPIGRPSFEVDPRVIDDPAIRELHEAFTLRFVTDRGISHEIVRHRPASYSQESTRYCNYSQGKFGGELTFIEPISIDRNSASWASWELLHRQAEAAYFSLLGQGVKPQDARDVLPTDLKTELIMTATADEWKHFLKLRTSEAAHPKIRELATQARALLREKDPEVFYE